MNDPLIITHYEHPPIPIRCFDWYAFYEGEEELGHLGWGHTEAQAIEDLKLNYEPGDGASASGEPDYGAPTAQEGYVRAYEQKYLGRGL